MIPPGEPTVTNKCAIHMKTLSRILRLSALLLVVKTEAEFRLQAQPSAPARLAQESDPAAGRIYLSLGIVAVVNARVILDWEFRERVSRAEELLRRQYVNNRPLLEQKLREQLEETLESLINDELILADAEAAGRQVPQEHFDRYIEGLIQSKYFGDSNLFLKALTAQDTTVDELRERHCQNDLVAAARREKVANIPPPRQAQIEQYYLSHERDFWVEESVRLSVILLTRSPASNPAVVELQRKLAPELLARNPANGPTAVQLQRGVAAELLARLKKGADFAEVAKAYSEGSHRRDGGDYGWIERPALRKELADVAFSLKPGELSEVIETAEELFILRVADRRPAALKPLADVTEEIRKTLQTQERSAVVKQWLDKLRAKTFIRYCGGAPADHVLSQSRLAKIEIGFVGPSTVKDAQIRSQLSVKVGEPVRRASVDRDIRRLYATGDFFNIRVSAADADGRVTLTYVLQERPVLSGIKFQGNKALSSAELLRKLTSKTGARLDERKLFSDSLGIEGLYRHAGYPQANVKYVVDANEPAGHGSVTFNITEKRQSENPPSQR